MTLFKHKPPEKIREELQSSIIDDESAEETPQDKKKEHQQVVQPPSQSTEVIKIGEIFIGSIYQQPNQLWELMKQILNNKDVQTYLQSVENKKKAGGTLYTG